MELSAQFRVNSPRVIHELFEDEVVVVNLDTGRYYSLQKAGARIWNLMAGGATIQQIVHELMAAYAASDGEIARAVPTLLQTLQREELIAAGASTSFNPHAAAGETRPAGTARPPFESPTLQTYTDMQDLLLLDPIHEVDEVGWPFVKKGPPDAAD